MRLAAEPALGEPLIAYAVKANGNVSVLRHPGAARRRRRHGVGGRDSARFGGRHPARAHRFLRRGQDRRGAALRARRQGRPDQRRVRAEFGRLVGHGPRSSVCGRPSASASIPAIGAGGHAKITTGSADNKFGVSAEEAEQLYAEGADAGLEVVGLACHIGSQIVDLEPLSRAFDFMRELVLGFRSQGLAVSRLDLGGGLGAPYFNTARSPVAARLRGHGGAGGGRPGCGALLRARPGDRGQRRGAARLA